MARGGFHRDKGYKGRGHPIMFGFKEALHFGPFPDGGGYPKTFLKHAFATLGVDDPDHVVHLCSGSMLTGIRVDVRPEMKADYVEDCRHTSLPSGRFRYVMADPPYSEDYANSLYRTRDSYPTPYEIMKEACRLLVVGGRFGILHFQIPTTQRLPMKILGVWGITQGPGFNIRAWSVFEKASR